MVSIFVSFEDKAAHALWCFVCRWADRLDVLSATATGDPESFLGHPVNAFKLIKRLNTEWVELENLVLTDLSDGTHRPTHTDTYTHTNIHTEHF